MCVRRWGSGVNQRYGKYQTLFPEFFIHQLSPRLGSVHVPRPPGLRRTDPFRSYVPRKILPTETSRLKKKNTSSLGQTEVRIPTPTETPRPTETRPTPTGSSVADGDLHRSKGSVANPRGPKLVVISSETYNGPNTVYGPPELILHKGPVMGVERLRSSSGP